MVTYFPLALATFRQTVKEKSSLSNVDLGSLSLTGQHNLWSLSAISTIACALITTSKTAALLLDVSPYTPADTILQFAEVSTVNSTGSPSPSGWAFRSAKERAANLGRGSDSLLDRIRVFREAADSSRMAYSLGLPG